MAYNDNNAGYIKYSSWGRTRQPKNLAGSHGATALSALNSQGDDAEASLADLNLDPGGADPGPVAHGLETQNQRYLHITCTGTATVTNLFVYSHATGVWTELIVGGGSVAVADKQSKVVEIAGVDRVAFRGTADAAKKVFFCGSTF